jgi:hypothetical protein
MHNRKRELGRKARSWQVNSLDFSFMFRKLPNPRRKSNLGESQTLAGSTWLPPPAHIVSGNRIPLAAKTL